jgi:hypothetical protein
MTDHRSNKRSFRAVAWFFMAASVVLLTTCELFSVGLGSKVDITDPEISITSHVSASYVSGNFILSGSAFDDVALNVVEVVHAGQLLATASINDGNWSATIVSANLVDGESQFIARASDSSGKRSEASVILYVDNHAPTVLVKTPVAYDPIDAVYNTRIQFRAYTYDRSPVDRVELVLYDQSGTEIVRKDALNIDGWLISIERGVDVPEAEWTALDGQNLSYEFLAHDRSGNVSSWFYHAADLPVGYSSVEDLGPADQAVTVAPAVLAARFDASVRQAGVSIDFDSDKPSFSISVPSDGAVLGSGSAAIGTVQDDDAVVPTSVRATVRLILDGTSYDLPAIITGNSAPGAQAYNFQIPLTDDGTPVSSGGTPLPDGEYEIIFFADDTSIPAVVGESDPLLFVIDKAVPSIQGIFPEPGGYIAVDTDVAVSAIVTDDNGLDLVRISLDGGTTWSAATQSVDPADPDRWTAVINVPSSTIPPVNVMFEATDTTLKTARFTAQYQTDNVAPTIEILAPDLSLPVNGRIRLRTFVTDNNSIASVLLDINASGTWIDYASRDVVIDTTIFTDPSTVPFQIKAKDSAGYETTYSGSFDVDQSSDIPVSGFRNLDDTATDASMAGDNLFSSGPVITGDAEDDDGIADGGVTYLLDGESWTPAAIQGASRFRTFSVDLSGMAEGIRSITVRTTDDVLVKEGSDAATIDIGPVWFAVDNANPVITVDGSWGVAVYKTAAGFDITGSASDANGITTLSASGAGSLVATGSAGDASRTWSVPVAAPVQGINTVTITATDGVGKISTQEVKFFYDSEVPDLSVDNLADGSAISSSTYTINGRVIDLSGIAAIEFSLNDGPVWDDWATVSTVSQSWSHLVSGLTEGAGQQIRFRARDNAGNVATTAVIGFALDLNPPTLTSNKASFDNTFQASDFVLSGTTSDANGINKLEISYDAGSNYSIITTTPASTTDPTEISWNQTVVVATDGADDGLKAIRIRATDQYDKETVIPLAVRFDSSAPTFGFNNLVDDQLLTALSYPATGTWTDNGGSGTLGGSAKIQWALTDSASDGDWTSFTATASAWNGSILFPGQALAQSLFVRAMDALGNTSASVMLTLKVDTELPTSTILHDGSADWVSAVYKTSSFVLSGVAADSLALGSVAVSGAGVVPANLNFDAGTGAWDIQITPPADGTYTYTITVTDGAGRETSYNKTVGYDTSVPTLGLDTSLSSWQRSTAVAISGTAADVGSGLKAIQYSLDGTTWTTFNTTSPWTGTVPIPAGDSNILYLRAMDNAGLTSTIIDELVKVDALAPTFTIDQAPITQTAAEVPLSGSLSDDLGLHATTPLTIVRKKNGIVQTQGVATYPTGTTWAYTQSANSDHSDDGLWELTFTAMDASGLTTVETRSFRIDTTAPALTVSSPAMNQSSDTSSFAISGSASDIGGTGFDGANDAEYSLNGADWTELTLTGTSWGSTIDLGAVQGARSLYLRSTDAVGNQAAVTVNFFYDNAPPTVTESGVGAATLYTKADIALSGTLFDTNNVSSILVTYVKSGDPTVYTALDQTKTGSTVAVDWDVTLDVDTDGLAAGDGTGLTDGTYTFTVTATDAALKTAVLTRTVVVDATSPVAPVITSTPGAYITGSLSVGGTASDATSGLKQLHYRVENSNPGNLVGTLTGTAEWYGTINVSSIVGDGPYELYVWAEDKVGNLSAEANQQFVLDRLDPELTITDLPAAMTHFSNADVTIAGTAADDNGIDQVLVTYVKAEGGSGTLLDIDPDVVDWSTSLAESLGDGTYTITVKATDGVGKTRTEVRSIVLDTIAPALSLGSITPIVSPSFDGEGLLISGSINGIIAIKGTSGDNTQLASLLWRLAPTSEAAEDNTFDAVSGNLASWTISYDSSALGTVTPLEQRLWIKAVDQAGNISYRSVLLDIDQATDKPTISLSTPVAGGYTGAGHIVRGTAADDDGIDITTLQIRWYNGTDWSHELLVAWDVIPAGNITGSATEKAFTYELPDLGADGAKKVQVRVKDTVATNDAITGEPVVLSEVDFTQDTANPVLEFGTPATADLTYRNSFTATGTADDAGLASLHVSIDGGTRTLLLSNTAGSQTWSYDLSTDGVFTGLSDGRHTLTLEAMDQVGKSASLQRSFYKDTIGPVVTFSNLVDDATPATAIVTPDTIRGTATDAYSALSGAGFEYRFDTDTVGVFRTGTFSSGTWSVDIPVDLAEGARTIMVRAADALGNLTTSSEVEFRLDRTAPTINFSPPATTLYNSAFNLSGTVTDVNDVASVEYFINDISVDSDTITAGTAVSPATAPWDIDVDVRTAGVDDGNYVVKIVATDRVGRTSQKTFAFTFDETVPVATLGSISPLGDGTKLNGSAIISATGSDENGLALNGVTWATTDTSVDSGSIAGSGATWTVVASSFDTTDTGSHTWEDTTRRVWVRAQDRAGNFGYTYVDRMIDQDSDRPVVKLTNLDPAGGTTLKNTVRIYGTVSDDDGQIVTIRLKSAVGDAFGDPVEFDGTSWSFDATGADGDKQLYIEIEDAVGSTFVTADPSAFDRPRVQTVPLTYVDTLLPIAFKVDTFNPEFVGLPTVDRDGDGDFVNAVTFDNAMAFGGNSAIFQVRTGAKDANGIDYVRVYVPGVVGSPVVANRSSGTDYEGEWTSDFIDITGLNGSVVVTIEIADNSGLVSSVTRTVLLDNAAPVITLQSPTPVDQVNGDIEVRGLADDGAGSGIKSISYQVGLNSDRGLDAGAVEWLDAVASGSMLTWTIPFTGVNKIDNFAVAGEATYDIANDIWYLPIIIRVEDYAGNVFISDYDDYVITVDPSGDKPYVVIAYPDPDEINRVLGGKIRVFGSAGDDDGVASVWMQIDTNNDSLFTEADTVTYNPGPVTDDWYDGLGAPGSGLGFQANGTYSWYLNINTSGEFNPSPDAVGVSTIKAGLRYLIRDETGTDVGVWMDLGADATPTVGEEFIALRDGGGGDGTGLVQALNNRIRFRVRSQDINGTYGPWSSAQVIDIDNRVPTFGAFTLERGAATMDYRSDMWISSDFSIPATPVHWYLVGSISDESGIADVSISGDKILANLAGGEAAGWFVSDGPATPSGYFNYTYAIPVETIDNGTDNLTFTLTVWDGSTPQMQNAYTFSINYDNEAPEVAVYTGPVDMVQSNKTLTLTGDVTETGAGLARVAIYFARLGAATDRIYMVDGSRATVATRIDIADLGDGTAMSDGLGIDLVDGLPRLMITGATRPTDRSLSHADIATYSASIRKGGLVKIGGLDRIITNVSGDTIEWADEVPAISECAIAFALVVDNQSAFAESPVWDGMTLDAITNDDGDWLIEAISKAGALYSWDTSIDSRQIPDGPLEVRYVAYDAAGNWATGTQTRNLINNPPRLSKVFLGTDLDGNGTVGDVISGETVEFGFAGGGTQEAVATALSSAFVVRGRTAVGIEVLGGNGSLYAAFAANGTPVPGHSLDSIGTAGATTSVDILSGELGVPIIEDAANSFVFTVWDSTEEWTPGTDSQYALLTVPLSVDAVDGNLPYTGLYPLFWNDISSNSIYQGNQTNGHIDISGNGDADADLSGTVSLSGTAWDDQRLTGLYLYIGNGTDDSGAYAFTAAPALATKALEAGRTYYKVATYSGGTWTDELGNLATDGWQFTITRNLLNQDGHRVDWRLDWNTATLPDGAAENTVIRIVVEDKAESASLVTDSPDEYTGTADTRASDSFLADDALDGQAIKVGMPIILKVAGTEEAYITHVDGWDDGLDRLTLGVGVPVAKTAYRILGNNHQQPDLTVDIVPYVTDVSIPSGLDSRLPAGMVNASGTSITGWYPQYRENSGVVISGFNLPYHPTIFTDNGALTMNGIGYNAADIVGFSDITRKAINVNIPDSQAGGDLVVSTNGVASRNNANNNDHAYNLYANGLDDNCFIYIDDRLPTIRLAPFGRRWSTGSDDASKILAPMQNYNENVATHVDGSTTIRDGHVELAEHSQYSGLGPLVLTASSADVTFVGHGLVVGQMVHLRSRADPATPPTFDPDGVAPAYEVSAVNNRDIFYVASVSGDTFTLAEIPGGAAGVFSTVGGDVYLEDPEASGQVYLRGKVWDNERIATIQVAIAGFTPTSGASGDWFTVYNADLGGIQADSRLVFALDGSDYTVSGDDRVTYGHVMTWSLLWNSALLDNVAQENTLVQVRVTDKVGLSQTLDYNLDVVPYITDLTTGLESGTVAYIKRSATGRYPINQDDATNATLTIKGFNLYPSLSVTPSLSFGAQNVVAAGRDGTNFLAATIAKTSITSSGNVTVTTAGVPSINNLNDDEAFMDVDGDGIQDATESRYNSEAADSFPNITDDREVMVWDITTRTAWTGRTEAVMKPRRDAAGVKTGIMDWMFVNNSQTVQLNGNALTNSWTIRGGDFSYNSTGKFMYIFLHDMNWLSGDDDWTYHGSVQWGKGTTNLGGAYQWNTANTNKLGVGNLSFVGDTNYGNGTSYDYDTKAMSRYQNLRIEVYGNNTMTDNFVAYFDKDSDSRAIVFWDFKVGTSGTLTRTTLGNDGGTWRTDLEKFVNSAAAYGTTYETGIRTPFNGPRRNNLTSGGADSAYFDMKYDAARSNIYLVYYDETASKLYAIYNNTPTTNAAAWSAPFEIDVQAGQYNRLAVDAAGRMHIAYFDSARSALKYALVTPTLDGSNNITALTVSKNVVVDMLFTNGMYNSINLKDFGGGDIRPVIANYSITYGGTRNALRLAFPMAAVTDIDVGADSATGDYTGAWEVVSVWGNTAAGQDRTFIETTGTTENLGDIMIGYNGNVIEEAILLSGYDF